MTILRMIPSVLRVFAFTGAAVLALHGCGGRPSTTPASPGASKADAKAPARRWQCPMHPQIIKDAPGDCPICGMKLVPMVESSPTDAAKAAPAKAAGPRKILFYHSPMGTGETSPVPRKDSMGMDFVPVYSDETDTAAGPPGPEGLATVTVDARKESLLGIRTVTVVRAPFETSIRTTGRVAPDERRVHHVHTRYEGYVEHVTADFTGKYVTKGEALASIYSPELYATQQE